MEELIGTNLGGFQIKSLLAKGGMAQVFRAIQTKTAREVALKVIPRRSGEDAVERFVREGVALTHLEHPHILPTYDCSSDDDYLWIAMRLVEGGTLDDELARGPFTPERTAEVLEQIGSALDFAHRNGVVHRDLKPGNILCFTPQTLYLSDFGVAKLAQLEGLTASGSAPGTPAFMSPEQIQNRPVDARADQYSLGILTYQMLTGRLPFKGQLMTVLHQHTSAPPPALRPHNPALSEATEQVVLRTLEKDPARRFESVGAFVEAFRASLQAAPPAPRPLPWKAAAAALFVVGGLVMARGHFQGAATQSTQTSASTAGRAVVKKSEPPRRSSGQR